MSNESTGPLLDRVNAAVRDNPLSAGLLGAGLLWMIFGGRGGPGLATSAVSVAGTLASSGMSGVRDVGTVVADGVKKAVDSAAGTPEPHDSNRGNGQDRGGLKSSPATSVLQSRLADSLEQQPLLLGAIGLAVGGVLASAFPATEFEREIIGEKGAAVRDKLDTVVGEVKERAKSVVADVQKEAADHGLTLEAAKDVHRATIEKVRTVAQSAASEVGFEAKDTAR